MSNREAREREKEVDNPIESVNATKKCVNNKARLCHLMQRVLDGVDFVLLEGFNGFGQANDNCTHGVDAVGVLRLGELEEGRGV